MRTSPLFTASLYFVIGILFTYLAINTVEDTVWNFTTILLLLFATTDFVISIRLVMLHLAIKKAKKK
ncbi:YdiK family protein [Radiobacillus kanasensis]|uniref:YdiK family protein n=1 Tax=Radiobacillus kanasensis TaxID=2844358 RepID=UPI001E30E47B|nr:YdiK family protein [Radiobacillus kanasensis]UFT99840.1 YdiK family protein [Radiobacillus kanasensis]